MIICSLEPSMDVLSEGLTITLVGYGIVFVALVLLFYVFALIPKIIKAMNNRSQKSSKAPQEKISENAEDLSMDANAAISMALYMYLNEIHDDESNVVTIKRVNKVYSPWSSKIYAVRNNFNRS